MSDQAARSQLDLDAILAGIERDLAEAGTLRRESEKFGAEQQKLLAEQMKLTIEQAKLVAEARKLDRDRWLSPALAAVSLASGLVAVATLILHAVGRL